MRTSISSTALGMAFLLVLTSSIFAQNSASTQLAGSMESATSPASLSRLSSQSQALLAVYRKEQLSLGQEQRALVASGATAQQIQAWRQQNTARFEAQAQRLQTLALASYSTLRVTNRQPNIPANASQTLKNYLTTRMALANARALIHNRMVQQAAVSGSSLSSSQASQMREQENKLFQQQNAAQLILQGQRMQTLVTESAAVARPVPNVVVIPPNTSPQLAAYMTTRNQLRRERAEISNQYATATPSVRAAALQAWSKQNAGQIQQLQQQAQSLAGVSSTTEN